MKKKPQHIEKVVSSVFNGVEVQVLRTKTLKAANFLIWLYF